MDYPENIKLRKAHKRVEALKGFYKHLLVYVIINVALFVVRGRVLEFFQIESNDKNFVEWIDWNILIVPIFWGIGLLFHAAKVFQYKFPFLKNWEERQLKKFMKEE
ncbi:2TM domain-containing protein [Aequorivita todarodis]|uniref:2TM domain-containing protein n=1 Tax=Aequorivita todarodis TaxID=2036821 RepID=UPI00234FE82A|nr:2TM domain-containing protein [Aequorivita todarodis]MDC8001251.1 2TM domain-containing protein [Aequorivita todarodis]